MHTVPVDVPSHFRMFFIFFLDCPPWIKNSSTSHCIFYFYYCIHFSSTYTILLHGTQYFNRRDLCQNKITLWYGITRYNGTVSLACYEEVAHDLTKTAARRQKCDTRCLLRRKSSERWIPYIIKHLDCSTRPPDSMSWISSEYGMVLSNYVFIVLFIENKGACARID